MKIPIFLLFTLFCAFIHGQADFETDQLEAKLMQSSLQTFNGRQASGISLAQSDQVTYGIASTFVFKVQIGAGQNAVRISSPNNVPRTRTSLERE